MQALLDEFLPLYSRTASQRSQKKPSGLTFRRNVLQKIPIFVSICYSINIAYVILTPLFPAVEAAAAAAAAAERQPMSGL